MWHSLRWRMWLALALVGLAAIGTLVVFANYGAQQALDQFVLSDLERDRQRIEALLINAQTGEHPAGLQGQVAALGEAFGMQVTLVDAGGQAVVASNAGWPGQTIAPTAWDSAGGLTYQAEPVMVQVAPVEAWTVTGSVTTNLVSAPELFRDSVNQSLLAAGVVALAVAGGLGWAFSRRIIRPVEALTAAARQMALGDLAQRVPVASPDEIGQLAAAFNRLADSLDRAERLRRQMVSDIAHELRTPLTNIRGYLEGLRDGVVTPGPAAIASLHEEALLLARLIDDLQELALAEAGQLSLHRQPTAPAALVREAVAALQPAAAHKGVRLTAEVAPGLPVLAADAGRLAQVLRNLLHNALTHTPAGGAIVVAARAEGARLQLTIRDTGEGIAPEHLPYIFERFYRADPARARGAGGAGLGLAIARHWVAAHGGEIHATSTLGQGTTLTVHLPTMIGLLSST